MNQKIVISLIILVVVLVIGGVILSSRSDEEPVVTSTSPLVVETAHADLGDVDIFGGKVETEFVLTNGGAEDVIVLAGTTSCGCTEGSLAGVMFGMHEQMSDTVVIKAGESRRLTAIYDPLAHGPDATGPVTRQLFLKTNSEATPELEFRLSANVVKE